MVISKEYINRIEFILNDLNTYKNWCFKRISKDGAVMYISINIYDYTKTYPIEICKLKITNVCYSIIDFNFLDFNDTLVYEKTLELDKYTLFQTFLKIKDIIINALKTFQKYLQNKRELISRGL